MGYRILADVVAVFHLAVVLFMLTGGLLAWRWPRLVWVHAPVALVILAINLAGAACPVTDLELHLRRLAGEAGYADGFIAHYLVDPVHSAGLTPGVRMIIYAIAIIPNAVAYSVIFARHARGEWPDVRREPVAPHHG